ncbi:hypothetical protein D6774_02430 [Candidatus Woesearchaeota archaeon]|nr:MAG: hypothetical protein D6774_02430 [Candidatus Woesearchaeota archaeon]
MKQHLLLTSLVIILSFQLVAGFEAQGTAQPIIEPISWEQVPLHIDSIEPLPPEELYELYAQEQGIDAQANPLPLEATYQAKLTREEVERLRSLGEDIAPLVQLYEEEFAAQEEQQKLAEIDRETQFLEEELAAQKEATQLFAQSPVIVQEEELPPEVQEAINREFELLQVETNDELEKDRLIMQIARDQGLSFEEARNLYNVYEYVAVEDVPLSKESKYFETQAGLSQRESKELVRALQHERNYIERIERISQQTGLDFETAKALNDQFELIASEDFTYQDPNVQELQLVLGVDEQKAKALLAATKQSELNKQDPVEQLAQAAQVDRSTAQQLYNEFEYLRTEDVDLRDERAEYLQVQIGLPLGEAQKLVKVLDSAEQPLREELLAQEAGITVAQARELLDTFDYLQSEDIQSTDDQAKILSTKVEGYSPLTTAYPRSSAALTPGGFCPVS